jgi:L-threonylcarbamoyladenylate synthase
VARTRVLLVDRDRPSPEAIAEAAAVIARGGLVAFPTETVYGLGANALDADAVAAVFEAKARPEGDPLIVHLASADAVSRVADAAHPDFAVLARFWPGPLTLLLHRRPELPPAVTAGLDSVGVRVPAHAVAHALLTSAGVPIAAPSANRFSRPSPTRAAHVLADLDGRIDLVLDAGPTALGIESTVLDLTGDIPTVRRHGGVTIEALAEVLSEVRSADRYALQVEAEVAPGQALRHYAPRATLTLYEGPSERVLPRLARDARASVSRGVRVGVLAPEEDLAVLAPLLAAQASRGRIESRAYGSRREPHRAARELFEALRALDEEGVGEILATAVEPLQVGRAVRDRLIRAAEGRIRRA